LAIAAMSNLARASVDVGAMVAPESVSQVYLATRAVRSLGYELARTNRNVLGLVSGFQNFGSALGIVGALTDKMRNLAQSTRQWLDDLFVVSAGALAAQYEEALWDVRAEAMDVFDDLERETIIIQTRLMVDDEQVRQALQPLAAINVPLESIKSWAKWSLKVSQATGAAAADVAAMAGDLITFNVRAKTAYRAMDKIVGAAHSGYMSIQESVETLKEAVELMGTLGRFGDEAFDGFVEGLTLARAALNTMGIPNWRVSYDQFKQSIQNIADITSEEGQRLVAVLAQITGKSIEEVRNMAFKNTRELFKTTVQATMDVTRQLVDQFGGIASVTRDQWKKMHIAKIIQENYALPADVAKRVMGDLETAFKKYTDMGLSAAEAQRRAWDDVTKSLKGTIEETERQMQTSRKFSKLWREFKSQISETMAAFKELGHTFMVSFGTPLLFIGKAILKLFLTPLREVVTLFIVLNERTHGLISYLTTLTIALLTIRQVMFMTNAVVWARTIKRVGAAIDETTQASSRFGTVIATLRERSRVFDLLAGKVEAVYLAIKQKLIPATVEAASTTVKSGAAAVTAQSKFIKYAAGSILWFSKALDEMMLLQSRAMTALLKVLSVTLSRAMVLLTNPYVLIGTALVVGLNYFSKYKQEILDWLEDFPNKVESFVKDGLVQTVQDFVGIVPELTEAIVKAIVVALRELPSAIPTLGLAVAKAFVKGFIAGIKGLAESFQENFWSALFTTASIVMAVRLFVAPKLAAALLRYLPGPVTRALSTVFATAGSKSVAVLSRIPFMDPIIRSVSHLYYAFESVSQRILRSWASFDWKKALKAGELNLLVDKVIQTMRVAFDELAQQAKLLWSSMRTALMRSRIGSAFVTMMEGAFARVAVLFKASMAPIRQALSSLGSVVVGSLMRALPGISAFATQAMAMLAPLLTNPYVLVGVAVVAAVALLWKYRKKLVEWGRSVVDWLRGLFDRVVGWVTKAAKIAFYLTPAGMITFLIKTMFPELWDKAVSGFKGLAGRIAGAIGDAFSGLFDWVVGRVKELPGKLFDILGDVFSWARDKVLSWVRAIVDKVKPVADVFLAPFKVVMRYVDRLWQLLRPVFALIQRATSVVVNKAAVVAKGLKVALAPVMAMADKVKWITSKLGKIKGWFSRDKKPKPEDIAPKTTPKIDRYTAQMYAQNIPSVVGSLPMPSLDMARPPVATITRPVLTATARPGVVRPIPTTILQGEAVDQVAIGDIADNTEVMVDLLRRIEANTRRKPGPRRQQVAWMPPGEKKEGLLERLLSLGRL